MRCGEERAGIDFTLTIHSFSTPSSLSHLFCINIHVCFLLCLLLVNRVSSSSTPPLFSSRGRHCDGDLTVSSWVWGLLWVGKELNCICARASVQSLVPCSLFPGDQARSLYWVRAGWWQHVVLWLPVFWDAGCSSRVPLPGLTRDQHHPLPSPKESKRAGPRTSTPGETLGQGVPFPSILYPLLLLLASEGRRNQFSFPPGSFSQPLVWIQ